VRGAVWILASRLAGRAFDLLKALILARLLTPADFGLFGIAMLAMTTLDTLSQTGMAAALIQRRGDVRPYLGTAWTIQLARSLVLAGLLYVAAPTVAVFFNEPGVTGLLRFVTLILLAQGLLSPGVVFFSRDLDFKRAFVFDAGSSMVSLGFAIALAYRWRSPWALVWANLIGVTARVVLSFTLVPMVPRLEFARERAAELFAFGKWMSGYAVATWAWQNLDRLVVGRVIGVAPLGIYQMAQRVANMPVSEIAVASMGVTLPAYAKLQGEKARLAGRFLDVYELVMSFVAPMAGFLVFAAPHVIGGLLGPLWMDAVLPLQIISVGALLSAIDVITTPLLVAVGKPKIEFWKNLARTVAVAMTILPLTSRYGLNGACVAFVIGSIAPLCFCGFAVRAASVNWRALGQRTFLVGVVASAVATVTVGTRGVAGAPGPAGLALAAVGAGAAWLAAVWLIHAASGRGALAQLAGVTAALRGRDGAFIGRER
jgi:O-antigen/teichoic acid export membrane protein